MSALIARLKALADKIDPQTDGIAILIVGDVQYEFGVTSTGDVLFDVERLATALWQAFRMDRIKPRGPETAERN